MHGQRHALTQTGDYAYVGEVLQVAHSVVQPGRKPSYQKKG